MISFQDSQEVHEDVRPYPCMLYILYFVENTTKYNFLFVILGNVFINVYLLKKNIVAAILLVDPENLLTCCLCSMC